MDNLPRSAWLPVTPRGVSAFARAKPGRLLVVQFLVAVLVAASVVWVLYDAYFPAVTAAIEKLPEAGEIRAATLDWRGEPKRLLAENRFIAFNVDLDHAGRFRSVAHVQVEFGRTNVFVFSLPGYREFHYPADRAFAFNRSELIPTWGAWQPPLLAITAGGVIVFLMANWFLLAIVYTVPVWLVGFFTNRDLDLRASWRLAGAALLPGALLMAGAILCYDFGALDLVHLGFATGFHFLLGWIYLGISPLFLPRHLTASVQEKNPFAPPPAD